MERILNAPSFVINLDRLSERVPFFSKNIKEAGEIGGLTFYDNYMYFPNYDTNTIIQDLTFS
jgi:hypothetical protein